MLEFFYKMMCNNNNYDIVFALDVDIFIVSIVNHFNSSSPNSNDHSNPKRASSSSHSSTSC